MYDNICFLLKKIKPSGTGGSLKVHNPNKSGDYFQALLFILLALAGFVCY